MTPNWLPIRCDLHDDPAVISIAAAVGCDEFAVVGRLVRLWSWANEQLADGNAPGVTVSWIDRYLSLPGFAVAMVNAGWLTEVEGGVAFPKFDVWNSQGAKRRLLTSKRVQQHRRKGNAKGNADSVTGETRDALPRERERGIDKDPPNPPEGGSVVKPARAAKGEHRHFAAFWAAYPRKVAKPAALAAFTKLDPDDVLFAAMLAALEIHKRSPKWTKDNGEYITHPSTWLNQRRWEDLPPEVGRPEMRSSTSMPYTPYEDLIPKPGV